MIRNMSVPVMLLWLAGNALANDSAAAVPEMVPEAAPLEPVFAPAPVAETPTASDPLEASVAPAGSDSGTWAPTTPEAEPAIPLYETVAQAPPPSDPKSIQLAKEQALQDSITKVEQSISNACASVDSEIGPLSPKDEFETSDAFEKRKAAWTQTRDSKCASLVAPLKKQKETFVTSLKDLQKSAASLQGTLEISSIPKGAKVFIDGQERGKTPLVLENLWAGNIVLKLTLDGYQEFIASPEIKAKDEVELEATLQEKSIFSEIDEVNLSALLAKDTPSVVVYQARIARIQARITQVDGEFQSILQDQQLKNPLAPKNEFETQEAFDKRQAQWMKQNEKQSASSRKKYDTYRARLNRAIEVLQDYILVQAGEPKSLAIASSAMTLTSYNADAGKYGFTTQYEQDGFAFLYEGNLKMSTDDAKATKKVSDGFELKAKYYDIPVVYNGSAIYPAWHSLEVAKAGKSIPTEGAFKLPAVWYNDPGVAAAIARADSLRKGLIDVRNLDATYALNYGTNSSSSSSRVWMWVARGLLFAASAASGTYGYLQQKDSDKLSEDYNPRNAQEGVDKLQEIRDCELRRDRAYFASAILAIAGTITFAF